MDVRRIELPGVRIISMSPDGSSIAGVRPAIGYAHGELCTFVVATLDERVCMSVADLGSPLRIEDVTWSPDGSSLVFTANAFQTLRDGDLWLMDAATGEVSTLIEEGLESTGPPQYGVMPTWAANGTALITGGGDVSRATLLTLDGGLPEADR